MAATSHLHVAVNTPPPIEMQNQGRGMSESSGQTTVVYYHHKHKVMALTWLIDSSKAPAQLCHIQFDESGGPVAVLRVTV